jgi:UDP-N-acetylmuramate dehydrogenase
MMSDLIHTLQKAGLPFKQNLDLQPLNTFGVAAHAPVVVNIHEEQDLQTLLHITPAVPKRILGGGSNVLIRHNPTELLLRNCLKGRWVKSKNTHEVIIRLGSGENWHETVMWTLDQGWFGLENLALIPGTVGAAPIQNIGAYGVEFRAFCQRVGAISLSDGEFRTFSAAECQFGYRDSIFKGVEKGKYFIVWVEIALSMRPQLCLSYGAISEILHSKGLTDPCPLDVAKAVMHIRQSKLPDPKKLGNAGSFFKNPVVPMTLYQNLIAQFPKIIAYPQNDGLVKLAAGWLIEQCGWKGARQGNVGCHQHQALVLVNYGGASGEEIWIFAKDIMRSVRKKFGVDLEPEVNLW